MRPVPLLNRSRQRGAALLALALLLISILLGAFFGAMNSGLSNREQSASDALAEARDVQRKAARAMTAKSRKVLTDHGMQLNEIDPAELARMKNAVKPVTDKYAAQLDPALIKAFYAELEKTKNLK